MRYDTPVYFQRVVSGAYDPTSGNYGADTIEETKRYASVSDMKTETLNLVYGEIRQGSFTVQLQRQYNGMFDRITIDDKRYKVDYSRRLKPKHVFVVSEVK